MWVRESENAYEYVANTLPTERDREGEMERAIARVWRGGGAERERQAESKQASEKESVREIESGRESERESQRGRGRGSDRERESQRDTSYLQKEQKITD